MEGPRSLKSVNRRSSEQQLRNSAGAFSGIFACVLYIFHSLVKNYQRHSLQSKLIDGGSGRRA